MGVPANFHGKKGKSGRKSIKEEILRTLEATSLFFDEVNQEEIEKRIASGKFSILDRAKLTAMEGDSRILSKFMDKAIPDAGNKDKTDSTQPIIINVIKVNQNGVDRVQIPSKTISVSPS